MAITQKKQKGFALLIAVIFMSVMLTFGLELGSIAFKQESLSSEGIESQYAFYAADAALECALYADQQNNGNPSLFTYPTTDPHAPPAPMACDGKATAYSKSEVSWSSGSNGEWVITERLSLDSGARCADVTVYKPTPATNGTTYIYSQGYDVSCATVASPNGARISSRGLSAEYPSP
jgi:Tfp pilus assembly protein PilV